VKGLRHGALPAVVLAALVAPVAASAATRVTGVVRTSLRPVSGVTVAAPVLGAFATTDSTGRFVLGPLPPGPHEITLVAVGYATATTTVVLPEAGADPFDAGPWLLVPLRPDEQALDFTKDPAVAQARLADSLAALAPPPPLAPRIGLFRTQEELLRGPAPALAEFVGRIDVADSITAANAGTGAPGYETWRQWADRIAVVASDSARAVDPLVARDSALVFRTLAYARARAALAAGPTHAGYAYATAARQAIARARAAAAGEGLAFLSHLGSEIDRVFVPGSTPPPAPKAPAKRKSRRTRGR